MCALLFILNKKVKKGVVNIKNYVVRIFVLFGVVCFFVIFLFCSDNVVSASYFPESDFVDVDYYDSSLTEWVDYPSYWTDDNGVARFDLVGSYTAQNGLYNSVSTNCIVLDFSSMASIYDDYNFLVLNNVLPESFGYYIPLYDISIVEVELESISSAPDQVELEVTVVYEDSSSDTKWLVMDDVNFTLVKDLGWMNGYDEGFVDGQDNVGSDYNEGKQDGIYQMESYYSGAIDSAFDAGVDSAIDLNEGEESIISFMGSTLGAIGSFFVFLATEIELFGVNIALVLSLILGLGITVYLLKLLL